VGRTAAEGGAEEMGDKSDRLARGLRYLFRREISWGGVMEAGGVCCGYDGHEWIRNSRLLYIATNVEGGTCVYVTNGDTALYSKTNPAT
jgi:hypothetical protein